MLVLNEAFYIQASVFNTLQFVDELLIMDGGSEDGTLEFLQDLERENKKLRVIVKPQADKRHYHPSWDQPKRWNTLIDQAKHNWIYVVGADECLHDGTKLWRMIKRHPGAIAFRFPRYAVTDEFHYTPNWFPDLQMRLFDRNADGGIRFSNRSRHCTPKDRMGTGNSPRAVRTNNYLVHYHHGFGPKKHALGKGMRVEKVPKKFSHPWQARKYIIGNNEFPEFRYDFRLYGKAGFTG